MKLQELFEQKTETMVCIRSFSGKWADMARQNKPIPVPPRGISWWKGEIGNSNVDTVMTPMNKEIFTWYAGIDPETDRPREHTTPGVIISTTCRYTRYNDKLQFHGGWGIGVEKYACSAENSRFATDNEWLKHLQQTGAMFLNGELHIPCVPLTSDNQLDVDHTDGLTCIRPTTDYKILVDFGKV